MAVLRMKQETKEEFDKIARANRLTQYILSDILLSLLKEHLKTNQKVEVQLSSLAEMPEEMQSVE